MNPLTQVKNVQKITARETAAGISDEASWHANYKDSAYIFAGGIPYELTEGDLLAVFAQYGELVDVNLIRDNGTGKSKGFAFLAYADQRSTTLAVDNLNGAKLCGRIVRVDHVGNYRRKKEEDEEERQKKREENGVCYDFQRGHCSRGDSCKYSHDEKRNANTGWGADDNAKWKHDQFQRKENNRKLDEPRPDFKRPTDREDKKRPRDREYDREDRDRYTRRDDDQKEDDYRKGKTRDRDDRRREDNRYYDHRRKDASREDDRDNKHRKDDWDASREDGRDKYSSREDYKDKYRRDSSREDDREHGRRYS